MDKDQDIIKWIWQHPDYPNFNYNKEKLTKLISEIDYNRSSSSIKNINNFFFF